MEAKNKLQFCLISLIFLSLPIVFAQESSPQLPHFFYGTSKINNIDTPVGTVIIAQVNGTEKGRIITTEIGEYGGASANQDKLLVQGNIEESATIEFYVAGVKANEVHAFSSGDVTEKDLTWNFPSTIEISQASFSDESITCIPGTTIEVIISGLELNITCDTAASGTINNVTNLGGTYFVGSPEGTTPISNSFEISITGDFDVIAVMSYNDTGIDEATITIYKFVGGSWVPIPSSDIISVDTINNKITFRIIPGTPYSGFGLPPTTTTTSPAGAGGGGTGGGGGGGGAPATTTTTTIPVVPTTITTVPVTTTLPTTTTTTVPTTTLPSIPTPGGLITGLVTLVSSPIAIVMISILIIASVTLVFYIRKKK